MDSSKCPRDSGCQVCWQSSSAGTPSPPEEPGLFKVQLRLACDGGGPPFANSLYRLRIDTGSVISGTTDGNGFTDVYELAKPFAVQAAEVALPATVNKIVCCAAPIWWFDSEITYVGGAGSPIVSALFTRGAAPITDVAVPKGKSRGLTAGEMTMARTVFADSIDYAKVKIHHSGYPLFFGLQDKTTAVTPNGEMYMPHQIYRDDYSWGDAADKRLFMHEMAHVWQDQMGYNVAGNGLRVTSRGASAYVYQLTENSRLGDFNMEQQGNIISDYYMICILRNPAGAYNPNMKPSLLYQVMGSFVNPVNRAHLPTK